MYVVPCFVAAAALLVPTLANAQPRTTMSKLHRIARVHKADSPPEGSGRREADRACLKAPVEVTAGGETSTLALAQCDGSPAPQAVDQLSILARPAGTAKPKQSLQGLGRPSRPMSPAARGSELAPGIRRLDGRLVERMELVIDHFRHAGQTPHISLVSGYRPKSARSYHSAARALDFRIEGVENEALVAFCKTLPDTGCGYYPNSVFVHMDVREPGAGHVAWIDASRPGEAPRYVTAWPAPAQSLPGLPADSEALDADSVGSKPARKDLHTYFF